MVHAGRGRHTLQVHSVSPGAAGVTRLNMAGACQDQGLPNSFPFCLTPPGHVEKGKHGKQPGHVALGQTLLLPETPATESGAGGAAVLPL